MLGLSWWVWVGLIGLPVLALIAWRESRGGALVLVLIWLALGYSLVAGNPFTPSVPVALATSDAQVPAPVGTAAPDETGPGAVVAGEPPAVPDAAPVDEAARAEAEAVEARAQKACEPGSTGSRLIGRNGVVCGCGYTGTATSLDGTRVCAGGLYTGTATSNDGKDVACGGRYTGSATSNDGKRVCAGGLYTGTATSNDGKNVACGGKYTGSATSNDGHRVCAGGLYTGTASSNDGSDVACGGLYTGTALSNDGKMRCQGGMYGR
jgi:hypothetical protein